MATFIVGFVVGADLVLLWMLYTLAGDWPRLVWMLKGNLLSLYPKAPASPGKEG